MATREQVIEYLNNNSNVRNALLELGENEQVLAVQALSERLGNTEQQKTSAKLSGPVGFGPLFTKGGSTTDVPGLTFSLADAISSGVPSALMKRPMSGVVGSNITQGANLASGAESLLSRMIGKQPEMPAPVPNQDALNAARFIPRPVTETGEKLDPIMSMMGSLFGAPGQVVSGTARAIADEPLSDISKQVQKGFFPFQKEATARYGQVLREGRKTGRAIGISTEEAKAAFSPIYGAPENIAKQIPKVVKDITSEENLFNLDAASLLRKKAALKRSLTTAERNGTIVSDRSRVINEATRNIDSLLSKKLPGIGEANKAHAVYYNVKEIIEKAFEPIKGNLPGVLGTQKGERYLKNILKATDDEIASLRLFENSTNINIVDPAKRAAHIRNFTNLISKVVPLAAGIELLRRSGAPKIVYDMIDYSN